MKKSLYLHEEVLLLALKDQKGTIDWRAGYFQNIIAGAILAELLLAERISIDISGKKRVSVKNQTLLNDQVLSDALTLINSARRYKSLEGWVMKLAGMRKLKERVASGLCMKGILKEKEAKIFLVFKSKRYPEIDPQPEQELLRRIEEAIFTDQNEVDTRTTILISMAYKSGLLSIPFSSKILKDKKKRINQIINGELIGQATAEVIEAMEVAIMIATIMPAVITATSNH